MGTGTMDDETPPLKVKEWPRYPKAMKAKRPANSFEVVLATLHLDPQTARTRRELKTPVAMVLRPTFIDFSGVGWKRRWGSEWRAATHFGEATQGAA